MPDATIFFFPINFLKLKHYGHIYIFTFASCKIRLLNSSGKYFTQKKYIYISTAKTLALNYFTPKVFRVTHHDKLKFYNIRPPAKVQFCLGKHNQVSQQQSPQMLLEKAKKLERQLITRCRVPPMQREAFSNIMNQQSSFK